MLNSDPNEYPPIGTSLGHFREHGNGRFTEMVERCYDCNIPNTRIFRILPENRACVISSASGLTSFIYILRGPRGQRNEIKCLLFEVYAKWGNLIGGGSWNCSKVGEVPPLRFVFNEGSTLQMRYFYRVMTTFSNERVGSDPGKWGGPPPPLDPPMLECWRQ